LRKAPAVEENELLHAKPRRATTLTLTLSVSSCLLTIGPHAAARAQEQPPPPAATAGERGRGIGLYEQGNVKEAVKALRAAVKLDQNDGEAWHFLGLALSRAGDTKGARKAAEKAVKLRPDFAPARAAFAYLLLLSGKLPDALREAEATLKLDPQNAEAHYVASAVYLSRYDPDRALKEIEAALAAKPNFAAAFLFKSQVLLGVMAKRSAPGTAPPESRAQAIERTKSLYRQAAESLERYLQLEPSPPDAKVWREQLATLRLFAENSPHDNASADRTIFDGNEVTTRAQLLARPEPSYSEEARKAGLSGTVVLRAVFAADGTLQNIIVLRALPYGMTERAIAAARRIKFVPATKDGRPVSQFIQIEYNFNLY
jgi:TonB family protein